MTFHKPIYEANLRRKLLDSGKVRKLQHKSTIAVMKISECPVGQMSLRRGFRDLRQQREPRYGIRTVQGNCSARLGCWPTRRRHHRLDFFRLQLGQVKQSA